MAGGTATGQAITPKSQNHGAIDPMRNQEASNYLDGVQGRPTRLSLGVSQRAISRVSIDLREAPAIGSAQDRLAKLGALTLSASYAASRWVTSMRFSRPPPCCAAACSANRAGSQRVRSG